MTQPFSEHVLFCGMYSYSSKFLAFQKLAESSGAWKHQLLRFVLALYAWWICHLGAAIQNVKKYNPHLTSMSLYSVTTSIFTLLTCTTCHVFNFKGFQTNFFSSKTKILDFFALFQRDWKRGTGYVVGFIVQWWQGALTVTIECIVTSHAYTDTVKQRLYMYCNYIIDTKAFISVPLKYNSHRLYMELDLQSLFGFHVHSLVESPQLPPPPLPPHLGSYTRALLVSRDRRHLLVTPSSNKWVQQHLLWLSADPPSSAVYLGVVIFV